MLAVGAAGLLHKLHLEKYSALNLLFFNSTYKKNLPCNNTSKNNKSDDP